MRAALEKLRKIIKTATPGTTEVISYKIPVFKHQGRPLVGLGAAKKHCSFFTMSSSMILKLARMRARELEGYEVSGATIHFTPDKPLPAPLVIRLVKNVLLRARTSEKVSLDGCSSSLAALGEVLFQDASFGSVAVGSEPKLHDFDALLTTDSLGLDKLPLPYLSGGVPALLACLFQLSALVVVVCPIKLREFGRLTSHHSNLVTIYAGDQFTMAEDAGKRR